MTLKVLRLMSTEMSFNVSKVIEWPVPLVCFIFCNVDI